MFLDHQYIYQVFYYSHIAEITIEAIHYSETMAIITRASGLAENSLRSLFYCSVVTGYDG